MATSAKTLTSTAWVQISAGNVYIENKSWEPIYWVGASSQPNINTVLSSAHYLPAEMKETIALDQPIWARTASASITIPVTEF